ncbi:hypothetical protein Q73A0000_03925 [Kaistella flava (ex Peng et al. 2021)]|uniref:Uncharacterized protein n=1 Tax=Kaistella flava (ex Peng et al. 2021) TaxID=2038776 RepID=A0A7M2Y5Y3_9FLAO|nr:hypothetical protein [Kaistella flava (ex Peng et al. 2021)]QOW09571.1 hypothetical protein Q73A0000_03925 [Kaistella flava (ex Peng et al. 2021)]
MSKRIKKIKRDICLIKYRKLPLIEYEKDTDSEVYYFPNYKSQYWIKLEKSSSKTITAETIKILKLLDFKKFIFLNGKNKSWISKETQNRKDYKPLIKTLQYFKSLKIDSKFNGGIQIEIDELDKFLPNFYEITSCDSGFFDYHFTDINQNIIFYIHYSGEIQILPLNKKYNIKLLEAIKQTKFIDSFRDNTDRI